MHKFTGSFKILLFLATLLVYTPLAVASQPTTPWTSPMQKCWEYLSDNMTTLNPASDNESTIYLPQIGGKLIALDNLDGTRKWKIELGGDLSSYILYKNKKIILSTNHPNGHGTKLNPNDFDTNVRQLEKNTGITEWTLRSNKSTKTYINFRDSVRYVFSAEGIIETFDQNNKLNWRKNLNTNITSRPLLLDNKIYIGTSNKTILIVSQFNGEILSQINIKGLPNGTFANIGEKLFAGDSEGNLYALNLSNLTTYWQTKTGGKLVDIDLWLEDLLVLSDDNFVYLISARDGKKKWKRKLAGRIIGKAFLDNDLAIFLTYGSDTAIFLDLKNGDIINRIQFNDDIYFVSSPLVFNNRLFIPTNIGLYAFSPDCSQKQT